jgi:hypothetical protein
MMFDRKKPGVAFWITVVVVVALVVYPLSFGLAVWISARLDHPEWNCNALELIYGPLLGLAMYSGPPGAMYLKYIGLSRLLIWPHPRGQAATRYVPISDIPSEVTAQVRHSLPRFAPDRMRGMSQGPVDNWHDCLSHACDPSQTARPSQADPGLTIVYPEAPVERNAPR